MLRDSLPFIHQPGVLLQPIPDIEEVNIAKHTEARHTEREHTAVHSRIKLQRETLLRTAA